MLEELPAKIERWTARRRMTLVLAVLNGDLTIDCACTQYDLRKPEVEEWVERFRSGAENALRSRPHDDSGAMEQQIRTMKQKIGEMVLEMDLLRTRHRRPGGTATGATAYGD